MTLIAIFFSLDRYLKNFAKNLNPGEEFNLIGDILSFSFARNEYIAFSLPIGGNLLLSLITLTILYLTYLIIKLIIEKKYFKFEFFALTFIVLGAISNMIDRFQYGYVIDYLNFLNFSILNIADIMIVLGTLLYFMYLLNYKQKNNS